jgi:hypothetical protein
MPSPHYVIVGSGLAGAVLARQLVENSQCQNTVLEGRFRIAVRFVRFKNDRRAVTNRRVVVPILSPRSSGNANSLA